MRAIIANKIIIKCAEDRFFIRPHTNELTVSTLRTIEGKDCIDEIQNRVKCNLSERLHNFR